MSVLKASVVDMVTEAGEAGVLVDTLYDTVFKPRGCARTVVATHVWQINELLADEGYKIVGLRAHASRNHPFERYRMTRIQQRRSVA